MYFNRFLEKKCVSLVEKIRKKHMKNEKLDETDTASEERQHLTGMAKCHLRLELVSCCFC